MNEEIKNEIEKEVRRQINNELDKTYRKIIRRKSFKIFIKNLLILALMCLSALLAYLLYDTGYLDNNYNESKPEEVITVDEPEEQENLIEKYSYLLNNIQISEKSNYISDYYNGNLTNELKNYLTINLLDFNKYSDEILIIDNDTFKKAYETLFDDYKETNFVYNNSQINYAKKIDSYVSNKQIKKEESNIKRDIINIEESNGTIYIDTIEYLFKHDKKYNVLTQKAENDIERLNKVKYVFKNNKLIKIEK